MLREWLDRGNDICDPFARFALYWFAFNGIYTENTDTGGERDRVCKSLVELEDGRIESLLCKLRQNCLRNLQWLAERHPKNRDGTRCRREMGVLDLKCDVVYPIDIDKVCSIDIYIESINRDTDTTQCKELRKQIGDVLYTIRCNLFHGDKHPEGDDECVIRNAVPILKAICETWESQHV